MVDERINGASLAGRGVGLLAKTGPKGQYVKALSICRDA